MMGVLGVVPYSCIIVDSCWRDFFKSASLCLERPGDQSKIIASLQETWTRPDDPRRVLPCTSVRTALDLYLSVRNFPRDSEIIMSAVNIPDMATVVHHHGLKIVSLDVAIDTLSPKAEWLQGLLSEKTVAMLLAHVYGKWFDMEPFVAASKRHKIDLIEDCAEGFSGLKRTGHPEADISLFSFGVIKYATAYGGGIAKVKRHGVYSKMVQLYSSYPVQTEADYMHKVMKYSLIYLMLNNTTMNVFVRWAFRSAGIDAHSYVVSCIRSFPKNLTEKLRHQPCSALLKTMQRRFSEYSVQEMDIINAKAEYVRKRLPESATQVGTRAFVNNHWLFPILVEQPDEVAKSLNALGVDAYRGATQLTLIEPDDGNSHLKHLHSFVTQYPHEAQFLIDHVVYLPVQKNVPFTELDKICKALDTVLAPGKSDPVQRPGVTAWKTKSKL